MECLGCGRSTSGSRCPRCRSRRARGYDAQYERDRVKVIAAQPWCHWPGGCQYPDSGAPANPLTADHVQRPSRLLVPMCKRHNSGKRDRVPA